MNLNYKLWAVVNYNYRTIYNWLSHHEVHEVQEAGFTQIRTSVQPCQNDSLKTALLAKQTINGISLLYSDTKYNQLQN
jgi:hypothetical protein